MSSYDRAYEAQRAIAAIFDDAESARRSICELEHAGFRSVWLGVANGAGEERRLHDALVARGFTDDEVLRVAGMLAPGRAVVTVNGYDYTEKATTILIDGGARLAVRAPELHF